MLFNDIIIELSFACYVSIDNKKKHSQYMPPTDKTNFKKKQLLILRKSSSKFTI